MNTKKNQRGMSAILFAMVFTIILSLLAIGFTTLVRNDQRQTLDQTLGYQAQYAAETAINQVVERLNSPPIPSDQNTCTSFDIGGIDGVKVTCVTWTSAGESIIFNNVGTSPKASKIKGAAAFNKLSIKWSSSKKGRYPSSNFPNTINANNYPILRVVYRSEDGTINKHLYFVPFNGIPPTTIPLQPTVDGSPKAVNCDNSECSAVLVMNIAPPSPIPNGYISISTLGNVADSVTIRALQGSGGTVPLLEAQYTIDATAVAQDITKRVQARVPYGVQTWRPGFAVAAEQMCKDIKIDGDNNDNISGAGGGEACPGGTVVTLPGSVPNPNSGLEVGINSSGGGWVAPPGYAKLTAEITKVINITNATECTWYLLYKDAINAEYKPTEQSYTKEGAGSCDEGSSHTFNNITKPGYYNIRICVFGSNTTQCAQRGGDYYRPAP